EVARAGEVPAGRLPAVDEARGLRLGDGGDEDRDVGDRLRGRLRGGRGDRQDEVVPGGGEAARDRDGGGLVALGVLLVVLDVEPGVLEGGLEPDEGGVERGVRGDLRDTDGVGAGVVARTGVVPGPAVVAPAGGEEEGGGGQGAGQSEGGARHWRSFQG